MRYGKIFSGKKKTENSSPPSDENVIEANDAELAGLAADGDTDSFTVLMRRYEKKIYAFVLSYVRNSCDAEDITQETFIRAYRFIGSFSGQSSFSTWLHTIAKNLSLTFLEERAKELKAVSPVTDENDPVYDVSDGVSAEDEAMNNGLYETILSEMDKLGEGFREAIVLREIDGLTYEQIAEVLGISVGTVKSRISRARSALREALKDRLV